MSIGSARWHSGPDGTTLALGSSNGPVWLLDLGRPEAEPTVLRGHARYVESVAFSPDGTRLASGGMTTHRPAVGPEQPEAEPTVLRGHADHVLSVAFSPMVRAWPPAVATPSACGSWQARGRAHRPGRPRGLCLVGGVQPDGTRLASGSATAPCACGIWASPRRRPPSCAATRMVVSVAFSPMVRAWPPAVVTHPCGCGI